MPEGHTESPAFAELERSAHARRVLLTRHGAADWHHVLERDSDAVVHLLHEMRRLLYRWPIAVPFVWLLARLSYPLYRRHGHFVDESDAIADRTGILSRAEMAFCQRQYSWSHIGCTTAAFWDEAAGHMVCARSLDWPAAKAIANSTRYYDFHDRDDRVICRVAGLTGMVGVLTAVRPGTFSVVLNFAKVFFSARPRSDPTFLIRRLACDPAITSYSAAIEAVLAWEVGAPCFITLCGVARGEACVIEFPPHPRRPWLRAIEPGKALVQANHYDPDGAFAKLNTRNPRAEPPAGDDWYHAPLVTSSGWRRRVLEHGLDQLLGSATGDLDAGLLELWRWPPVFNGETAHLVVMRPATGSLRIWTRHPDARPALRQ
jgi:hypothetical protein